MKTTNDRIVMDVGRTSNVVAPRSIFAGETIAQAVLTVVFLLTLLQYCFERTDLIRLIPICALFIGTLLMLVLCPRERGRTVLLSAIRPGSVLMSTAVSVLPLLLSLDQGLAYPVEYGLIMVLTLLAARILLSAAGPETLLLSFFYATTVGMMIVVGITFHELIASFGSTRYWPLYLDPNRTGFFAATAVPAQVWFATRRPHRKHVLIASVICVLIIVAASSRGSAVALLIGAVAAGMLYGGWKLKHHKFGMSYKFVVATIIAVSSLAIVIIVSRPVIERAGDYLWTKMELGTRDRGLDSGFTGRTYNWSVVLDSLEGTSWLTGNGYRTTDDDFQFAVDNGYLSSVYELGILVTTVVLAKYVVVMWYLTRTYITARAPSSLLLTLFVTLLVFLANAFVHRVMFGYGDPPSLLALFAFVSKRNDLRVALQTTLGTLQPV